MPGPASVNVNSPIRNVGGFAPSAATNGNGGQTLRIKDYTPTIDDFRQFAAGSYNAGLGKTGEAAGSRINWARFENEKVDKSEASAIRLAFAFALEAAGVSGDRMAEACRRLGLTPDFAFAGDSDMVFKPLSRAEVREIIEQNLGALRKAEPETKATAAKPEVEAGPAMPKISSQAEFESFVGSLSVDSRYGTVSEDGEAKDVNGDMRKTFTYSGLVFRLDDRGIDHPTMKTGFASKKDLSVPENRTEAMGLGIDFADGKGKQVKGMYGISGESGVSTAKTIDGCIQYRHGKCTLYVIDTTKLPKGEKAWDMERALYGNGYKKKAGDVDETKGEVNASFIPKSAIVGWVEIDDGDKFGDTVSNEKRLEFVKGRVGSPAVKFNPEYKA